MSDREFSKISDVPIPGDKPGGSDVSFSDDFQWLEQEIAKLTNPVLVDSEGKDGQGGGVTVQYEPVDWDRVEDTAFGILESESKDLRVLAWLTAALIETQGVVGISIILRTLSALVTNRWDHLFPKSPNGRINSMLRIRKYAEDYLKDGIPTNCPGGPVTTEVLNKLVEEIEAVKSSLVVQLTERPEALQELQFSLLRTRIDEALKTVARPVSVAPRPITGQQPASAGQPQASPASPQPGLISSEELLVAGLNDVKPYFRSLQRTAVTLHGLAIKEKSTDPLLFRWIRMVYWCPIDYPDSIQFLPLSGPNQVLRQRLEGLYDAGDWPTLFEACELAFARCWFWLDLQRYAIASLENMGELYQPIRSALVSELRFLLQHSAHLTKLSTQDKIEVASDETRAWLLSLEAAGPTSAKGSPASATAGGSDKTGSDSIPPAFKESDNLNDVLKRTKELGRSAKSGREAYWIHLRLAAYLVKKKRIALAYEFIRDLSRQIDIHKLSDWEPELTISTIKLHHQVCLLLARTNPNDRLKLTEEGKSLATKMALLDPVLAEEMLK